MPKVYVLYDARARTLGTANATVLVTEDSEEEARKWTHDDFGEDTCWYQYDLIDGKGENETPRPDLDSPVKRARRKP